MAEAGPSHKAEAWVRLAAAEASATMQPRCEPSSYRVPVVSLHHRSSRSFRHKGKQVERRGPACYPMFGASPKEWTFYRSMLAVIGIRAGLAATNGPRRQINLQDQSDRRPASHCLGVKTQPEHTWDRIIS